MSSPFTKLQAPSTGQQIIRNKQHAIDEILKLKTNFSKSAEKSFSIPFRFLFSIFLYQLVHVVSHIFLAAAFDSIQCGMRYTWTFNIANDTWTLCILHMYIRFTICYRWSMLQSALHRYNIEWETYVSSDSILM